MMTYEYFKKNAEDIIAGGRPDASFATDLAMGSFSDFEMLWNEFCLEILRPHKGKHGEGERIFLQFLLDQCGCIIDFMKIKRKNLNADQKANEELMASRSAFRKFFDQRHIGRRGPFYIVLLSPFDFDFKRDSAGFYLALPGIFVDYTYRRSPTLQRFYRLRQWIKGRSKNDRRT